MEESKPQEIAAPPPVLGRYELIGALARGGMATVYLGRHSGEAGFQRLYAIKVMHPHLADDENFVSMLLDEARIAARLHHPNVVPITDLGSQEGAHYVVMEYVEGCSLSALLQRYRDARPPRLLVPLFLDALAGLHAAHTLTDDEGNAMHLVHRDVSPQNVLVGIDGTARITDFGIAKAESRIASTRPGQLKGKLAFMAPEQVKNASVVDARTDVFSLGAMLWSALTGRKLFLGESDAETLNNILQRNIPEPSTVGFKPPAVLDAVCLRALERDPAKRFATAAEMEDALRSAAMTSGLLGRKREIGDWVSAAFGKELAERRATIRSVAVGGRRDLTSGPQFASSGFRMVPSLMSLTPSLTSGDVPSAPTGSLPRAFAPSLTLTDGVSDTGTSPAGRRKLLFVGLPVAAIAFIGLGVLLASRAPARSAKEESSPTIAATAAATANVAPTATTVAAVATQAPPLAATTTVASLAGTSASPPTTTHAVDKPRTVTPAWTPAPPAAKPKVTAAAAPAANSPTPNDSKKKSWDSDSPLPPQ